MAKRKLTAEDIEKDPSLVDKGYAVGDEYEFPEDEVTSEEKADESETTEGEGGESEEDDEENGNHPPKKGGN